MQDAEARLLEEREGALAHEKEALQGWQAARRELAQAGQQVKVRAQLVKEGGMGFARVSTHFAEDLVLGGRF